MAEGHFGGGGSVRWAVTVDDDERDDPVKKTTFTTRAKGCRFKGVDKTHSDDFVIAVKVPGITGRHEFVKWLLDEAQGNLCVRGGAARFRLAIRDDDDKQISVRWK
jgi:hypothetical protein